jgi:hypothetical protein
MEVVISELRISSTFTAVERTFISTRIRILEGPKAVLDAPHR